MAFLQLPKHVANNKLINLVVTDGLYFFSAVFPKVTIFTEEFR
jgi:hypothetical protein